MTSTRIPASEQVAPLKDIQRFIWSQGDYSEIARENVPAAQALLEDLGVRPGLSVLDVAAGDGNLAVCAARLGAEVAAVDITPQMVDLGRRRCEAEKVSVKWSEGDAEDLPYVAGTFDRIGSVFGAMFAPRPEQAARELFRVVRPGGRVGLAAWTPDGFIGRLAATVAAHMPQPPVPLPPPTSWGDEQVARERFEPFAEAVTARRASVRFARGSTEELIAFHERCNGPLIAARALLRDAYPELREELRRLIEEFNRADGRGVEIYSDYLLVTADAAVSAA